MSTIYVERQTLERERQGLPVITEVIEAEDAETSIEESGQDHVHADAEAIQATRQTKSRRKRSEAVRPRVKDDSHE